MPHNSSMIWLSGTHTSSWPVLTRMASGVLAILDLHLHDLVHADQAGDAA